MKLEYYMSLDYPIVIEAIGPELGGGYEASIPHLGKWAFCADGETREAALTALDDVKKALFEDMLSHNKLIPLPPKYDPSLSVSISWKQVGV